MLFLSKLLFFFLFFFRKQKNIWQPHTRAYMYFLRMRACTHAAPLKADPRQYFPFNNANKHLYCFVWWMAWFMRKTSHQQYFTRRIPGDSERRWLWGRGEGDAAAWVPGTSRTCCPLWSWAAHSLVKNSLNMMIFYCCLFYHDSFLSLHHFVFPIFLHLPVQTPIHLSQVSREKEDPMIIGTYCIITQPKIEGRNGGGRMRESQSAALAFLHTQRLFNAYASTDSSSQMGAPWANIFPRYLSN